MKGPEPLPQEGREKAPEAGAARAGPAARLPLLLALLTVILLAAIIAPVVEERLALRDELARIEAEIARAQSLVAAAPELEERLRRIAEALAGSGLLLEGDSTARAAAQLQTRIRDLAEETQSELRQLQVHDTPAREPDLPAILEPVEVETELVTDIQGLHRMLAALEGGPPLVFVRALHVRARLERADPETGTYSVMPELIVSMTVRGYHLLPGGKTGGGP